MPPSSTDREWERWGQRNPYYGVLGFESAAIGDDTDARKQFFASGEAHIQRMLAIAAKYFGASGSERALDFGCGVGRLLLPLSSRFKAVVGIDVSPSMLSQARTNVQGHTNVQLASSIADAGGQFDFVHTFIVLQHIRPGQGFDLIEQLLAITKPGGIFVIHTTIGDLVRWRQVANFVRYRVRPAHWLYNLVRRRPISEPITEMNHYDAARLLATCAKASDEPLVTFPLDQDGHVGIIVIGRRCGSAKPLDQTLSST